MRTADDYVKSWSQMYANPPKLSQTAMAAVSVVALVLLVMAVLQAISFSAFKGALGGLGLTAATSFWAVVIIVAEVWAAMSLLNVKLPGLVRFFGGVLAVLVSGFWLVSNIKVIAGTTAADISSSGFFGKYLMQKPGWWTVVEATLLLFMVIYTLKQEEK